MKRLFPPYFGEVELTGVEPLQDHLQLKFIRKFLNMMSFIQLSDETIFIWVDLQFITPT